MKGKEIMQKKRRIRVIEDRKIEILMKIAAINKEYAERVALLNTEYERLHRELYLLQIEMISKDHDAWSTD